ncbi:hypothetical protein [Pseudacidobacterium ailaaui]|uniref:hypothetical protein n=1 Tax=Pseudacidobacterium ailaaui TaxID=1382359 RepID=UPI00047D4EC7|nr:hypothetical protein [Pseudacidobacterium ailaaui]MBX6359452.1 hypothetical protein [Pseudacidobacterium ailaaui]MCL6463579.1 hypothetical protein [Pseudacidobacterium ailaaui]MDI3254415.1 hypothetical protein [Bacillota bacterium]
MGTLGHSLPGLDNLSAAAQDSATSAPPAKDGLGAMRALAFVLLFNAGLVVLGLALWSAWRWLR